MPRLIYSLLMRLVALLLPCKLLWRGLKQPDYLRHWSERYGCYPAHTVRPLLWIHCVSVGETRAAQPLIVALLQHYPQHGVLMTHTTPTGRETGRQLFGAELATGRIVQAYLPVDTPCAVRRFFNHFQPQLGMLMETELWFNLIAQAHQRQMPIALLSARLSVHSARGYARLGQLTRNGLQQLALVAAQTADDAQRLQALGAQHVLVCGNLKFDVSPPAGSAEKGLALRQWLGATRTVMMAASTREGEEAMILDAVQGLPVLILIVPRHPQRFAEVEALIQARGLRYALRTELNGLLPETVDVVLGNSMGEMYTYYAASDFAVMGGSLQPLGGQNLIEAASMGVPTILGPHMFNFAQVTVLAVAQQAAVQIDSVDTLRQAIRQLADHPAQRQAMAQAARAFTEAHKGTTGRILQALAALLPEA